MQAFKPSASPGRGGAKADLYQMTQFFSNTVPQWITRRRLITRREQRALFCTERRQTDKRQLFSPSSRRWCDEAILPGCTQGLQGSGAGGEDRAIPGERCWGKIQDATSCGRLHSTDSLGTCSQHRTAAFPVLGLGQRRVRYSGRAAGSICLAWISLGFCPSNGGFWCCPSAGARTGKSVVERHLHPAGSGRSGGYESIIFFGEDGAGEAQQPAKQLNQPAPCAALSCSTSPLGTHLKFWQKMGAKSQGLDERAARMQGRGATGTACRVPPRPETTIEEPNPDWMQWKHLPAPSPWSSRDLPWDRQFSVPPASAPGCPPPRSPGSKSQGRKAARRCQPLLGCNGAGSCWPGGGEEKGRGGISGFC